MPLFASCHSNIRRPWGNNQQHSCHAIPTEPLKRLILRSLNRKISNVWFQDEDDWAVLTFNQPSKLKWIRKYYLLVEDTRSASWSPRDIWILYAILLFWAEFLDSSTCILSHGSLDTQDFIMDILSKEIVKEQPVAPLELLFQVLLQKENVSHEVQFVSQNFDDSTVNGTDEFESVWGRTVSSDHQLVFLWQMRARILHEQQVQNRETVISRNTEEELIQLINRALYVGAYGMVHGINASSAILTWTVESAGDAIVSWNNSQPQLSSQKPEEEESGALPTRNMIVLCIYLDATKRCTEGALNVTQSTMSAVQSGASHVILRISSEDGTRKVVPVPISLAIQFLAGTIGAGAMVAEALAQATSKVVAATAETTAHVLEHKYGPYHRRAWRDTSSIAHNVTRTVATVSSSPTGVVWNVAKTTGKLQLEKSQRLS